MEQKVKHDPKRLRQLYESRVPTGMSMAAFGEAYGIGTKAMVWQYLEGYRPLNFEAAAKFARGLRCTIADINPELAKRVWVDVQVLGKISAKAVLAMVFMGSALISPKVEAAFTIIVTKMSIASTKYTLHLKRWLSYLRFHRA